jgi:alkaline phosphatase D
MFLRFSTCLFLLMTLPTLIRGGPHLQVQSASYAGPDDPVAISTFDINDEGWITTSDARCAPQPCYASLHGNPGGHIYSDDALQGIKFYFSAPDKFLGNLSHAYGWYLSFDLRQRTRTDRTPTNDADIVLVGGGTQLVYDTPANPPGFWCRYNVMLHDAAGWRRGSLLGPPATADEMRSVLASLSELRIRGDYMFGQSTTSLDNVVLGSRADIELGRRTPRAEGLNKKEGAVVRP